MVKKKEEQGKASGSGIQKTASFKPAAKAKMKAVAKPKPKAAAKKTKEKKKTTYDRFLVYDISADPNGKTYQPLILVITITLPYITYHDYITLPDLPFLTYLTFSVNLGGFKSSCSGILQDRSSL